jgi:hypothetical protein
MIPHASEYDVGTVLKDQTRLQTVNNFDKNTGNLRTHEQTCSVTDSLLNNIDTVAENMDKDMQCHPVTIRHMDSFQQFFLLAFVSLVPRDTALRIL